MAIVIESTASKYYDGISYTDTIVCPAPTGIQVGDLLVCTICAQTIDDVFNTPAGWTKTNFYAINDDGLGNDNSRGIVFYKVAVQADTTASDFTFTLTALYYSNTAILRISGYAKTQPLTIGSSNPTNNKDTRSPSIDCAISPFPNSMLLMITITHYHQSAPSLSMSGYAIANDNPVWTEVIDMWYLNGGSGTDAIGLSIASALRPETSSTGNASWTISAGGTTTNLAANAILVAINQDLDLITTENVSIVDSGNRIDLKIYQQDDIECTENNENNINRISNTSKNNGVVANQTKNNATVTNQTKNSGVITNQPKS